MEILSTLLYYATIGILSIPILLWAFDKLTRSKNSPPGPFQFPVLGVFPYFLMSTFRDKLEEWKKRHGSIISLNFGSNRVVIIHDYNLIKEAFNMDGLQGRPDFPAINEVRGKQKRGITLSEGAQWESQRRFALRHLRDFGFGKKSMEAAVQEDIIDLIAMFRKQLGQPISVADRFSMSVFKSLWRIITGQNYSLDDSRLKTVLSKLQGAVSVASGNSPGFTINWLAKLAPNLTGYNKFRHAISIAKDYIIEHIEDHQNTFQEGSVRDFMDVYIDKIRQTTDPNSFFYKTAGRENLLVGSINLMGGGSETTSSTLTWSLLYLSRNPEIQQKLQHEIDIVIGRSRLPRLDDKDAMPYTSAVILEVFRKSSFVPLGVPHKATTDVKFHGYTIAEDTIVLANLFDVHHDKQIWGDPDVFRPERFLTPDEKAIRMNHPIIAPFSVGKRVCIGETLARNNFFLFLVSIFQAFDIKEPIGSAKVKDPKMGLGRVPMPFQVIFEERAELE